MFGHAIDLFRSGGVMMWPLAAIGLAVLVLAARSARSLYGGDAPGARARDRLTALLFWGGVALALGLLGTFVGIAQAASVISEAGGASPRLVWSAIQLSLTTLLFGLGIFLVAALVWYPLWRRCQQVAGPAVARERPVGA